MANLTPAQLETIQSFLPRSRRQALARNETLPEASPAVCLMLDISGFTPLTESLEASLGPQQGAEALTAILNEVFEALIAILHEAGGDVLGFAGDSATCLFPEISAGLQAAIQMQRVMDRFTAVPTPDGKTHALSMKIGLANGEARRFLVGNPSFGLFDLGAGLPFDRMAAAEHQATKGEIIAAPEVVSAAPTASWEPRQEGYACLRETGQTASISTPSPEADVGEPTSLSAEALRPYFHPDLFAALASAGAAGGYQPGCLAELRPVVSAFVRFEGLDYLNDSGVRDKLDVYVRLAQETAAKFGGWVARLDYGDKGNVLHVIFGAPIVHEDDEIRAVGWALAMQSAVRELPFITNQVIGMSRGQVYAGALGARQRQGYTLMGDEVNASARLMQACQPGQVLVSQRIQLAAQKRYQFHPYPGFQVKGKYEPVPVATPLAPIPNMPGMLPPTLTPLIGRQKELALIDERLNALMGMGAPIPGAPPTVPGMPGMNTGMAPQGIVSPGIAGAPIPQATLPPLRIEAATGMGKSRLAAELFQRAMTRGVRVLAGGGQSIGGDTPYQPFQDILRGMFGLQSAWPPMQQAMQLQNMLNWVFPEAALRLPLLGDLLGFKPGVEFPDTPLTGAMDPQTRQQSLFSLVGDLLLRMSAQQPILLLIEDCHWLDEGSLALLASLSHALQNGRCWLVVTYRPSEDPSQPILPALAEGDHLILEALDSTSVQALISTRLGGQAPPQVLEAIQQRAQGNPLYVEELAETLRETSRLVQQPSTARSLSVVEMPSAFTPTWILEGSTDALRLPDNIQAVVLSRLDRLPAEAQLTLKVASVIGASFGQHLLSAIHPAKPEDDQLAAQTTQLKQRDFIQLEEKETETWGHFRHNLTQEVAYNTLLFALRRDLHSAIIHWYESTQEANLSAHAALLAHHCRQAGDSAKERRYARLAGEAAVARYANAEAVKFLSRALELTPPEETQERCQLLLAREAVYDLTGQREAQLADLEALEALIQSLGQPAISAEVALRRSHYAEVTGDYPAAEASARTAYEVAQQGEENLLLASAQMQLGRLGWLQGQYDPAREHLNQALNIVPSTSASFQAEIHRNIGITYLQQGKYDQARGAFNDSLAICKQTGDRFNEAAAYNQLGIVASEQGESAQAIQHYDDSLRIRQEIGDRRGELQTSNNLAIEYAIRGDLSSAIHHFSKALATSQVLGDQLHQFFASNNLGMATKDLGMYSQAYQYMSAALSLCRKLSHRRDEAVILAGIASLAIMINQVEQALAHCQEAIQIALEVDDQNTQAEALGRLGVAHLAQGDPLAAGGDYQKALELRLCLDQPPLVMEVRAGLAECALAQDNLPAALHEVEMILAYLQEHTLDGCEQPFQVYLTCTRVLQASQDARLEALLSRAVGELHTWAGRISDPAMRKSFLENVPAHRELLEMHRPPVM